MIGYAIIRRMCLCELSSLAWLVYGYIENYLYIKLTYIYRREAKTEVNLVTMQSTLYFISVLFCQS